MRWFHEFLDFDLIKVAGHNIRVWNLVLVALIYAASFLIYRTIRVIINKRATKDGHLDAGRKEAVLKIIKYVVYVIGVVLAIQAIGLNITVLIAGSAALFVGLGFGLQEAFQDFISGIILLFEGTISVGDVIEVESLVGTVVDIRLRTTKVKTRDNIYILVPNHKFVNEKVINWSEASKLTRFSVKVGVAYGSDTKKVEELLLQVANEHSRCSTAEKPKVFFEDFGDSSLAFNLTFWVDEIWEIPEIKSDLHYAIDQKFRENNITIPFPQRDLHIQSSQVPIGGK